MAKKSKAKREFKFYPSDFKPLPAQPVHMDLRFDVFDYRTYATNDFKMRAFKALKALELNAKNLAIKKVGCNKIITYSYDAKNSKLLVKFAKPVKTGEIIVLHIETICRPTHNELEGLYYDKAPEGAPPQQITQCQQWGFQKLTPCFDEMNAKCTYRTKIIADERYTHMISNGDVAVPRRSIGNGRAEIIYENIKTPMAPYLFCLFIGTYDEYKREFEYPDGKKFVLELLVLKGASKEAAEKALEILFNGILWIHLYTGAEKCRNKEKREKIYSLIEEREKLKLKGENSLNASEKEKLESLRAELKKLLSEVVLGYEYTGTVYREIAMQNSNFGGMENVGNTAITANRMLPTREISDGTFAYLMEVKTHEFYHNINGSEVTGWSPFELWLNEAITTRIGQEYVEFSAGEKYSRLSDTQQIILPHGTFDEDIGSMGMPIIPKGFNNPEEMISSVTYNKGPEFVHMVELLMGKEKYALALSNYHKKFSHGNAKTSDWIKEMEKIYGKSLKRMAKVWLTQTGYPTVQVKVKYDPAKKQCTLVLKQEKNYKKGMSWEFPFTYAIFTSKGKAHEETLRITKPETTAAAMGITERPEFYSFNRDFSFYGKVDCKEGDEETELYAQARKDDDIIARFGAFYKISDKEKMKLLENAKTKPSKEFIELYFELLSDEKLTEEVGSVMLAVPESVEDKKKKHWYEELYQAKKKIRMEIATKYKKQLLEIYNKRKGKTIDAPFVQKQFYDIKNRQIKNTCLSILAELDTPEIMALIKEQLHNPKCQTDKLVAFSLYIDSSASDKKEVISEFEEKMGKNAIEWEQFLSLIGSNESEDAIEIIKLVKASKRFNITQSNDQRALLMRFAFNARKSLLMQEGRAFLEDIILELAPINEYTTNHILSAFSQLNDMQEKTFEPIIAMLKKCLDSFDPEKVPSVYNTIRRLIKGAPNAVKAYEKEHGKLDAKYF